MIKPIIGTLATLAVIGCAAPATRISTGLQRYGLDAERSTCVGDRLQANLSLGQLQQLGKAAAAYRRDDADPTRLTASDLARVAGEIDDPKIAPEVGKAAAGCGVLL
ncbi:hypothetical protein F1C10_01415 [Sphingomonas sp. NBWT7]|uniref:hypothetical protein n=1 Tax=Sphingomonas sp. NBWT7 TaxID=2596913 RepID=UPI001623BD18|nr:hypothetical protein [Sphingomonas sp. NBWT7]QNE30760.1 hypothetical protein F1C10_01415 [Sphingomonas sp. NBWT7]